VEYTMLEEYQTSGFEEDVVSYHRNVPMDVLVEQSEKEDVPVVVRSAVEVTFDDLTQVGENCDKCFFNVHYICGDDRVDAPRLTVEKAEFIDPAGVRQLAKLYNFSVGGGYKEADILGKHRIAVSLHSD
jgi:hypothetical protein